MYSRFNHDALFVVDTFDFLFLFLLIGNGTGKAGRESSNSVPTFVQSLPGRRFRVIVARSDRSSDNRTTRALSLRLDDSEQSRNSIEEEYS